MWKNFFTMLIFFLVSKVSGVNLDNADARLIPQENKETIRQLISNEEFDKAFEQTKIILNSPVIDEDEMNRIAIGFLDKNRLEEGLYVLNVLLLYNSKNDDTLNNISWAYHMLNKNESANYFIDKALEILPNTEYEYGNKGNALNGLVFLPRINVLELLKLHDRL